VWGFAFKETVVFCIVGEMLPYRALTYLVTLPVFLVSLTIHEYAHAWVAYRFGDDTAKRMGRLTLNPLAHISLFGTIILPLLAHFGWAKPIPVDFSILTKRQIFKVAAAGPAANMLLAVILTIAFHLFRLRAMPLLGNFVLLAILFNIILAVFNLIPIPPLDGSKMVYSRLKSPEAISTYNNFARFGMLVLIGFLLFGGFQVIVLPVAALFYTLLGLPLPSLTIKDQKADNRLVSAACLGGAPRRVEKAETSWCRNSHGGTIVNIVTALIVLGLLGLGIWWVIKSLGQAGQQYSEALVDAKYSAITIKCQTNLRVIWQNLQMYATDNEGFPPSLDALEEWSGSSQLFQCPVPDGQKYVYIPGQNEDMSPENILVFEPKPAHNGKCSVLRLGGQIELLTPEELKKSVDATLDRLRQAFGGNH
jgi:Zn-dependent protease